MAYDLEPMLELFIYETKQMLDNIEKTCMEVEDVGSYSEEAINEIFRGMHTIKGSAGMMMYDDISKLSHALEDLFDLLRNDSSLSYDTAIVTDLTLETLDFIKSEMVEIEDGNGASRQADKEIKTIKTYIGELKGEPKKRGRAKKEPLPEVANYYIASEAEDSKGHLFDITIRFTSDCVMENVRSFTLMNNVREMCSDIKETPSNLLEGDETLVQQIKENGFLMRVTSTESEEAFTDYLTGYPYVESFTIEAVSEGEELDELLIILDEADEVSIVVDEPEPEQDKPKKSTNSDRKSNKQSQAMTMISVNVDKLDKLMDLVGELVVSEAMVTRNDKMLSIMDEGMNKAVRQHRKIINDMQDVAMSIRMVPLSGTFQKMKRIVRDVSKNLDKKMTLKLIGENTEADKNIIEKISDPLMHLIRNACDHGIEIPSDRLAKGKPEMGTITLEAKNSGGDVIIEVKDDGKGLDADRIYDKAVEKGLIPKDVPRPADEDLYNYIFMAGFSTKEEVSTYSGRGVGMDVVTQNIEKIGGSLSVSSKKDEGSTVSIKIPLTLTIVDGMRLKVKNSEFIIPITAIQESFKVQAENYVVDPYGDEIILIRGSSYHLLRLHKQYGIHDEKVHPEEGIVIFIGDENKKICLLADELIGEQQVVVKPLPKYINRVAGLSGCAILGDGGISLILDMDGLLRLA